MTGTAVSPRKPLQSRAGFGPAMRFRPPWSNPFKLKGPVLSASGNLPGARGARFSKKTRPEKAGRDEQTAPSEAEINHDRSGRQGPDYLGRRKAPLNTAGEYGSGQHGQRRREPSDSALQDGAPSRSSKGLLRPTYRNAVPRALCRKPGRMKGRPPYPGGKNPDPASVRAAGSDTVTVYRSHPFRGHHVSPRAQFINPRPRQG